MIGGEQSIEEAVEEAPDGVAFLLWFLDVGVVVTPVIAVAFAAGRFFEVRHVCGVYWIAWLN